MLAQLAVEPRSMGAVEQASRHWEVCKIFLFAKLLGRYDACHLGLQMNWVAASGELRRCP
jgi:hypothetical protein